MNISYLLIGGNEGDPITQLAIARKMIGASTGEIVQASALYQTAAWGKTDQPDFLNQALKISTPMEPIPLMKALLDIEAGMGRRRQEKYGPRVIDLDMLFFNDAILDTPTLILPHPELQNRRFVLTPLSEIAPDLVHPVLHLTIQQLLAQCPDPLAVKKLTT